MRAAIGDKILVPNHRAGLANREAVVLDVMGAEGRPPYLVRWSEDGYEGRFFPGPDAVVERYSEVA